MGTEAFFKFLIELADHQNESFRRYRFLNGADLEDGFLRAGLFVFEQFHNRAVALRVPRLLISCVLGVNEIAIMFQIVGVLDLLKTEIRRFALPSGLHGGHAPVAVPIDVLHDPLSGDVFTVLHIEAAVIVPRVVGPVFAGTPVVPCQFQSVFLLFTPNCFPKKAAKPPAPVTRSATGNTQYEPSQATTLPGPKGFTLWTPEQALSPCTRPKGLRPLDTQQALPPCTRPKGFTSGH